MATSYASLLAARIKVWDLPLRVFHWLLVTAIVLAFLSSEEGSALNQWHILAGWVAGILIVFRLIWGFVGGEHSRFADFVRPAGIGRHTRELLRGRPKPTVGHNALGGFSVLLLLAMIAATVWTGVLVWEEVHEVLAWSLLALVGIHVAAVILMSLLTHENLIAAMVTGTKQADRHGGACDAQAPSLAGMIFAALVVAGTIYGITKFDPLAFSPRSSEAYEHSRAREGNERGEKHRAVEVETGREG